MKKYIFFLCFFIFFVSNLFSQQIKKEGFYYEDDLELYKRDSKPKERKSFTNFLSIKPEKNLYIILSNMAIASDRYAREQNMENYQALYVECYKYLLWLKQQSIYERAIFQEAMNQYRQSIPSFSFATNNIYLVVLIALEKPGDSPVFSATLDFLKRNNETYNFTYYLVLKEHSITNEIPIDILKNARRIVIGKDDIIKNKIKRNPLYPSILIFDKKDNFREIQYYYSANTVFSHINDFFIQTYIDENIINKREK